MITTLLIITHTLINRTHITTSTSNTTNPTLPTTIPLPSRSRHPTSLTRISTSIITPLRFRRIILLRPRLIITRRPLRHCSRLSSPLPMCRKFSNKRLRHPNRKKSSWSHPRHQLMNKSQNLPHKLLRSNPKKKKMTRQTEKRSSEMSTQSPNPRRQKNCQMDPYFNLTTPSLSCKIFKTNTVTRQFLLPTLPSCALWSLSS
mmetsp:Transcript_1539/g.3443  ORF Transcript_1539/g.3443 Transcript_1539/m.3443 type:complete len:202 (+) Transcript_1539:231-836(+)